MRPCSVETPAALARERESSEDVTQPGVPVEKLADSGETGDQAQRPHRDPARTEAEAAGSQVPGHQDPASKIKEDRGVAQAALSQV